MKNKANVVLFTYLKTNFLEDILGSIRIYSPLRTYIVIDPSTPENESNLIEIIQKFSESLDITYLRPTEHLGISKIFDFGLNKVFELEERIIILEDDTLPCQDFFKFCNHFLEFFEKDESISSIIGTDLSTSSGVEKPAFFLTDFAFPFWGWATWKNRWDKMPSDDSFMELSLRENLDLRDVQQIFLSTKGMNVSWDIRWSMFQSMNLKKCVVSRQNLISNLGFGGLATFTRNSKSQFSSLALEQRSGFFEYCELGNAYSIEYFKRINTFLSEFK